jgi:hypothetical protein
MSAYFIFGAFAFVLIVSLIAFAINRRGNVRASFSLHPFGFSIEAKDDHENQDNGSVT